MDDAASARDAEIVRLKKIIEALMNRVEHSTDIQGTDFNLFQTTVVLEEQVRARTAELEQALQDNQRISDALRASEAKYRALVDQSLVGIVIIEDGRFTFTNPRFNEIFGYAAEEIRALDPIDLANAESRPLMAEQIRKRLSGESERAHYQIRGRRKDGSPVTIEIFGNTADVAGRRVLISIVQDVTERVEAEEARRESELRLRAIFDNSLVGIVTARFDDGRFDEVNDAFLVMTGYDRDEIVGMRSVELGFEATPEQRAAMINGFKRGESLQSAQIAFRTKAGEPRALLVSVRPFEMRGARWLIGAITDITELNRAKSALERQEARLQAIIDAHPSGMALFDAERRLIRWNARYQELLQYPADLLAQHEVLFDDLVRHNHARGDYPGLTEADAVQRYVGHVMSGTPLHLVRKSAAGRVLEVDAVPLPGGETVVTYTDITTIAQAEEQMRTLANHDPLTKLPNRRLLLDRIGQAIAGGRRDGTHGALMLIDLDEFKPLNDRFGHLAGDLLLVEVALRLKKQVRDVDTVARIGGDEFVVMLTGLGAQRDKALGEASIVAEKIRRAVCAPYLLDLPTNDGRKTVEHRCTCSIGIEAFLDEPNDVDRILQHADAAMYEAKTGGRNRICIYSDVALPPIL